MKNYKKEILKLIDTKLDENIIKIPPSPELGDYSFPCFILSKKLKKSPNEIALELSKIKLPAIFEKVEQKGPYLNFFLNKEKLSSEILKEIKKQKQKYGSQKNKSKKIVIESPGPNTNKPLHLGHLRNICLGNSLINLNKKVGNRSIRVDIVNDRGIHICKSMLAYKKYGKNKFPNKKPDHFVGDYYVLYSKNEKKLEKELNDLLIKWEQKDKETRAIWKKMNSWAMKGFKETYKRFGTKIDKFYLESEHYEKGKNIIKKGLEKGIFEEDETGNIIINLESKKLGKKVVLRSDGTSIYITQDLALADIRYKDYKMDKMIYIVGSEQIHHFKVLFEILKKLNYKFADNLFHLSYGMVYLPEGKMKSREGAIVDADNLINDTKEIAKKEIKKRNKKLSKKDLDKISEQIAISAIKFFMLKYDPFKDFTYNPKESLKFEGETGPYVQYSAVRINSILKKSKDKITTNINYELLKDETELKIINLLSKYPEVIEKSCLEYKPSLLCRFLLDLSQSFNEFYHKNKVLNLKNKELKKSRLLLISCVKEVLENGLSILGIEVPKFM